MVKIDGRRGSCLLFGVLSMIGLLVGGSTMLYGKERDIEHPGIYHVLVDQKACCFQLKGGQLLYLEDGKEEAAAQLVLDNVLDAAFDDLEADGQEELAVLTLDQGKQTDKVYQKGHQQYGSQLMIYKLSMRGKVPMLTLQYKSDMRSQHPWMLEAGKIDDEEKSTVLFIGVYKDTLFYHEVINRPFFVRWNGRFIERRWTGSYLSVNEYQDLVFVDFDHDGYDEVAALEKKKDGTFQVSLYKWLTFGFQYLMSSKDCYRQAEGLMLQAEGQDAVIWVKDWQGYEIVSFK